MTKQTKEKEELEKDIAEKEKNEEAADFENEITEEESASSEESEDEVSVLKKQAQENLEGWKRTQADFENYKKMQSESQKDLIRYATQNIILQVIPVLDNFHMSTAHIPQDQKDNAWVTGIMYIQKQLEDVLTENGIEEIDPKVGDNFDPVFHEAIADSEKGCGCDHCECDKEKFKNKIKKVMMKGYKIGDKVIRAARVVAE